MEELSWENCHVGPGLLLDDRARTKKGQNQYTPEVELESSAVNSSGIVANPELWAEIWRLGKGVGGGKVWGRNSAEIGGGVARTKFDWALRWRWFSSPLRQVSPCELL